MLFEYYYNRIKKDATSLVHDYKWNSSESAFAMKAAIASTLSMLIAYSLDFNQAYWASISSVIVTLPTAGATAKKALFRFFGTCLGALLAVFFSGLFAQNHILYSIVLFLFISISMYVSVLSKYSYFWLLMAITASIIMISAISNNSPDHVVYMAFNRWFEVSIGITVTSILNLLVWPNYAAHTYAKKCKELNKDYLYFITEIFEEYLSGKYKIERIEKTFDSICGKIKSIEKITENAKFEIKTARRQKSLTILDTKQLQLNINHLWDFYQSIIKFKNLRFHQSYCQYVKEIFNVSSEMINIKTDFNKKTQLINLQNSYLEQINRRYLNNKAHGVNEEHEIRDTYLFQEFLMILKEFVDFSKNKIFFNTHTLVSPENKLISCFPEEIYILHIKNRTIELSIPIMKYAAKVGFSVVAVIWLWQLFEIPSGGTNLAVAVLLVLQPDIMATYLKGFLRFLGCLAGVIVGFGFLFFQIESTFALCIFLTVIIYFAMYIYFKGGPAISYAGLQLSLAFLIAVLPEPHATLETTLFIKRLIGIFFGVSVAWIINVSIFSKDILSSFKEKLSFLERKVSTSIDNLDDFEQNLTIPDISSFYTSLNVITDQKEINMTDSFFINKYLKNIEKFFRIRYLLLCVDSEVIKFTQNIEPDIGKDITGLIAVFHNNTANEKEITLKTTNILESIEEFRNNVRYNKLTEDKSLKFRQHLCQYIINLKRITSTLLELHQLQRKINI